MPRCQEGFLWTVENASKGLITDAVQKSSTAIQKEYDVIVIGAGFAGLIAARNLGQIFNLRVLLLEARDRIGGRTWTTDTLGEELEMGGTWVHWGQPHAYSELQRYGLHRNLIPSAGTTAPVKEFFKPACGTVGELPVVDTVNLLEHIAQKFFSIDGLDCRSLSPYPYDPFREPAPWKQYDHLTVQDRLDQLEDIPQHERDLFMSYINSFGSAPGSCIGFTDALRWFAVGGPSLNDVLEKTGAFKIGNGGMTSFARAIFNDFTGDSLFNTVVTEINDTPAGVIITTGDLLRLKAKAVVSTIPVNCLGDIKFNPPLSTVRQTAIAKGNINKGTRINFKLRETLPGWFFTGDDRNSSYVFAFSDHNGTQPTGPSGTWCIGFGYNGKFPDLADNAHIIDEFKKDIIPDAEVEAYVTHDWANDPFAKGAWACWGPDCASKYIQELQKPHGRVVFASADWADGWRGFVDGAIERGQTAVRDAFRLIETAPNTSSCIML
ncbi:hypothetical protein BBP40_010144 [Aspergillus hancockii]|nr:hypothetical protein BBP40_010144 [Aspergillus hancockii]